MSDPAINWHVKRYGPLRFCWGVVDTRGQVLGSGTATTIHRALHAVMAIVTEHFMAPLQSWGGDYQDLVNAINDLDPNQEMPA